MASVISSARWPRTLGLLVLQAYNDPMSKADRIKEALGWLKVVFAALVAVDVSVIAGAELPER